MLKKVLAQANAYTPKLTKDDFDKNESKIQQEITQIEKNYDTVKRLLTDVTFNGKKTKIRSIFKIIKTKTF